MSLPDPMTPPDCDLRGYEFMPLFGQRLFGSTFYSLALQNPRAGLAAQKLWWEAWQQCPAGSLPSDELTLCRMADFGSDLKAWRKANAVAMHGFILCSDGRYYHPLLCHEAIQAFARRVRDRERKAKWRAGRDGDDHGSPTDVPRDTTGTERGSDGGRYGSVRADRTGQDSTVRKKEDSVPNGTDDEPSSRPPSSRDLVWSQGVPILVALTGKSPPSCRSLLGKMLRDLRDDCPKLLLVLQQAQEARPLEPLAWLTAATKPRDHKASRDERILRAAGLWDEGPILDHEPMRGLLQ